MSTFVVLLTVIGLLVTVRPTLDQRVAQLHERATVDGICRAGVTD
jgi:hypothetical protein